jgi:hypothetical protein
MKYPFLQGGTNDVTKFYCIDYDLINDLTVVGGSSKDSGLVGSSASTPIVTLYSSTGTI